MYSVTHSYTVQSMICIHGHPIGFLFLCLKEPCDESNENITNSSCQAKNIISLHSKFGKFFTSVLQYRRDSVSKSAIGNQKNLF